MWFFNKAGIGHGPIEMPEMKSLIEAGEVRRDTLVWREGMQDWANAENTELSLEFKGPPPLPEQPSPLPAMHKLSAGSTENQATSALEQVGLPPTESMWEHGNACVGKNYWNGKGRATRKEYWSFAFFSMSVLLIGVLAVGLFTSGSDSDAFASFIFLIYGAVCLWLIPPGISVGSRRLHDVGLSGWLYLLVIIPYLGNLFMLIISLIPSNKGANQYGPDPFAGR